MTLNQKEPTEQVSDATTPARRDPWLRLIVLWCIIVLWGVLWISAQPSSSPITLKVMPEAPRDGDPLVVRLELTNTSDQEQAYRYSLYSGNETLQQGTTTVPPHSTRGYNYISEAHLTAGQQVSLVARAATEEQSWEQAVALPPYPPQVWSSFVSFASFSTSMMGSISAVSYYREHFTAVNGAGPGFLLILSLLALAMFQDMTGPLSHLMPHSILGRLHVQFQELLIILALVFVGIAYTMLVLRI